MNIFYGGIFVGKETLKEAGIKHPIKLEYYKTINEDKFVNGSNSKYGIKVVKTEYLDNDIIENKEIKNLSDSEQRTNEILETLKRNEVTPIGVQDIMQDFFEKKKYL